MQASLAAILFRLLLGPGAEGFSRSQDAASQRRSGEKYWAASRSGLTSPNKIFANTGFGAAASGVPRFESLPLPCRSKASSRDCRSRAPPSCAGSRRRPARSGHPGCRAARGSRGPSLRFPIVADYDGHVGSTGQSSDGGRIGAGIEGDLGSTATFRESPEGRSRKPDCALPVSGRRCVPPGGST